MFYVGIIIWDLFAFIVIYYVVGVLMMITATVNILDFFKVNI